MLTKTTQDFFYQITKQINYKRRIAIPGDFCSAVNAFSLTQTPRITTLHGNLHSGYSQPGRGVTQQNNNKKKQADSPVCLILQTNHPFSRRFLIKKSYNMHRKLQHLNRTAGSFSIKETGLKMSNDATLSETTDLCCTRLDRHASKSCT